MVDTSNQPESDAVDGDDLEYTTLPARFREGNAIGINEAPTEWYEQTKKANRVARELQETYRDQPGVFMITTTAADETIGGLKLTKIEIKLNDMDVADSFPCSKDGIRIETTKANLELLGNQEVK